MHTFRAAGALEGEHRVTIRTASTFYDEDQPQRSAPKDPIPERYNTQSTLVRTVESGRNVIDFELTTP
jgi:hypothetical protein